MEKEARESIVFDELVTETPAAWCLRFDGRDVWLPKSQCSVDEDEGLAEVPMWLVKKQGLEGFIED